MGLHGHESVELDPTGNIYCKYQLHVKFNTVFTHDSKSVQPRSCWSQGEFSLRFEAGR